MLSFAPSLEAIALRDEVTELLEWLPPTLPLTVALSMIAWRYRPRGGPRLPLPPTAFPVAGTDEDGGGTRPRQSRSAGSAPHHGVGAARNHRGSRPSFAAIRRSGGVGPGDAAQWCDAIARGVRGGSSLSTAIAESERPPTIDRALGMGPGGDAALAAKEIGELGLAERLDHLGARPTVSSDLRLVLSLLSHVARLGGPAAEPIDRTASILRARAAAAAERATQSAQAKLSAAVMTALPVLMLAVLVTTSASVRVATRTPIGAGVVGLGVALNLIGWWWMHRIITGGQR